MAGKGRGRGASFTFDLQAIGFSRGEALPETQAQPLPSFPNIDYKAAALVAGEEHDYLLALKQELRGNLKKMPYYMRKGVEKQSIEKYITKYEIEAEKKFNKEWVPDWRTLPKEMKAVKRKPKKCVKKVKEKKAVANVDVLKKIEELEKKGDEEKSDEEEEKKKGSGDEEEEVAAEIEDEEAYEEENDYIASYFEDGDDYGNSDDNMDEATY
ncbi:DNA-directed RNA polymerase III subunit RPC7 isoform 1-T1 [Mantella aurantiaca]